MQVSRVDSLDVVRGKRHTWSSHRFQPLIQRPDLRSLAARATAAIFGCRRVGRLVNHPWVLSTLFLAARMAEPFELQNVAESIAS